MPTTREDYLKAIDNLAASVTASGVLAAPQSREEYLDRISQLGSPSVAKDIGTQVLHGLGRGIAAIPGLPGDIGSLMGGGLDWLLGAQRTPEQQAALTSVLGAGLPTSADLIGGAERNIIGPRPVPETAAGRFAGNVAPYVPSAMIPIGGPGGGLAGLAGRAGIGAASGAAAEGARELGAPAPLQIAAGMLPGLVAGGARAISSPASSRIREATRETTPQQWAAAEALEQAGRDVGIPLLGSEALAPKVGPGALGQLASDVRATRAGGPALGAIFEERPAQITEAARRYIGKIGPEASADDVLTHTKSVMLKAIEDAKAQRTSATRPLYQAAGGVNLPEDTVTPIIAEIDNALNAAGPKSGLGKRLASLRAELTSGNRPETQTSRLQRIYQELSEDIRNTPMEGGAKRSEVGVLTPISKQIQDTLIANNPAYARADTLYKRLSEPVNAIAGTPENPSLISRIAGAESNNELRKLLMDPENVSPDTVRTVADIFKAQGRGGDLAAWMRHHLEYTLDKVSKDLQSGQNPALGANWRNMIYGTPQQRAIWDSYLTEMDPTGGALRGWQRLAQVLERTAKTPGMGSPTAGRLQLAEEMGDGVSSTVAKLGAAAAMSTLGAPGAAGAGYLGATMTRRFLQRQASKMGTRNIAAALTSPDSIKKLRSLARKDPRSSAAAASVMAILGGREEEE